MFGKGTEDPLPKATVIDMCVNMSVDANAPFTRVSTNCAPRLQTATAHAAAARHTQFGGWVHGETGLLTRVNRGVEMCQKRCVNGAVTPTHMLSTCECTGYHVNDKACSNAQ